MNYSDQCNKESDSGDERKVTLLNYAKAGSQFVNILECSLAQYKKNEVEKGFTYRLNPVKFGNLN